MHPIRQCLVLCFALLLTGCGGGGDTLSHMSCAKMGPEMAHMVDIRRDMVQETAHGSVVKSHMKARRAAIREVNLYNAMEDKSCKGMPKTKIQAVDKTQNERSVFSYNDV